MATIRRLEELEAWKEARKLNKGVYEITKYFPRSEKYNTVKHLRESSRGVMGNIGEGFGRYHYRESMQFYGIAKGCLNEVKSDIYLSCDCKYIGKKLLSRFVNQIEIIDTKINGLIFQTKQQLKAK